MFQLLINRMDDWIIFGIKRENDIAYGYIKEIKRAINEAKKSPFEQDYSKEIHEIYKPYQDIPDYHTPIFEGQGLLSSEECKLVVEELKSIADGEGNVDFELLREYITRRLKSGLLPEALRKISMDSIQQYLVQENVIALQEIAIAVVLLGYPIPSEEQIDQLFEACGAQKQPEVGFDRFV